YCRMAGRRRGPAPWSWRPAATSVAVYPRCCRPPPLWSDSPDCSTVTRPRSRPPAAIRSRSNTLATPQPKQRERRSERVFAWHPAVLKPRSIGVIRLQRKHGPRRTRHRVLRLNVQHATNAKHTLRIIHALAARHRDEDLIVILDLRHVAKATLIVIAHQQKTLDAMRHTDRIGPYIT